MRLTGELLVEGMTNAEIERAELVESILPQLREQAAESDHKGEFYLPHLELFRKTGLTGLIVPKEFGGLGGSLRDLTAATFAMGTACPSTALAFFFHCSSASRGLLGLEAIESGLFEGNEVEQVKSFAHKVLTKMGSEQKWLANFASESNKSSVARISISTEATKTDGGWLLNGSKSFGCSTGVADEYLVTAKLEGIDTAEGLCVFFVKRDAEGVSERQHWDSIGMRACANHGVNLRNVFVADDDCLTVKGSFVKMMQMSRGTFVGNQLAATAIYLGGSQSVYDYALNYLKSTKFGDTGEPIASSPMHKALIGKMTNDLETAYLWMRRQLELETSEPPILPKERVVRQWRLAKGAMCEAAFNVAVNAFKACGTSNSGNSGVIARGMRDLSMGLVQAFPAERGRLEAAEMVTKERSNGDFAVAGK
ncbi:MAG: acyl-CoA/acyl-ACP dehydrogenase [Pyrinomonadaceae bacterium]|nr:acyl-CoA/acyl-ACP dehydrogenase [Pyrinomonadaceae bacterium]